MSNLKETMQNIRAVKNSNISTDDFSNLLRQCTKQQFGSNATRALMYTALTDEGSRNEMLKNGVRTYSADHRKELLETSDYLASHRLLNHALKNNLLNRTFIAQQISEEKAAIMLKNMKKENSL